MGSMSMKQNHEVIVERLDNIKEDLHDIKEHLKMLNGQTAKNTEFASMQKIINIILGTVGSGALIIALNKLFGG